MIISDRVKNLLNKVLPLFENITFGDIIQRMQQDIEAGGGGGGAFASQAEAEAGTDTTKYMNSLRTAQAILAQVQAGNNITLTPVSGGVRVDASASGSSDYIFWPSAPVQDGNVFKVWSDLCAAIAALPDGTIPTVTFRESFTVPTAGMPVDGWDMRLGKWYSPIIATGATIVTLPNGVIIKNLIEVNNGLLVEAQPTTADGVFTNDLLGGLVIILESLGAKIANTGTKALVDASAQVVWVRNGSTNSGVSPTSTGPLVKMNTADTVLAIMFGESPNTQWEDECFIGGVAGSQLLFIHGVHFNMPTLSAWTGDAPVEFNDSQAKNLIYDNTTSGLAATQVQAAIDELAGMTGAFTPVLKGLYGDPRYLQVTLPLKIEYRGFNNIGPGTTEFVINPSDPIVDKREISIQGEVYVGEITGGVVSRRTFLFLATFSRNGAIGSLTKDIQIIASSPSIGGPTVTLDAYDDGSGHVGVQVTYAAGPTIRVWCDLKGSVEDDATHAPYFNS